MLNLKVARRPPHPFVVRVLQLFMAIKGEKAEKWPEIQELIKPLSFKTELWKLSHQRINPLKLQLLNKLLPELNMQNTEQISPLAANLLEWMHWVTEKESRGRKVGRGLRCGILLSAANTPSNRRTRTLRELVPTSKSVGRNSVPRRGLTVDAAIVGSSLSAGKRATRDCRIGEEHVRGQATRWKSAVARSYFY